MIYKVLYFIKICLCVRCRCGNIYCAKNTITGLWKFTMEVKITKTNGSLMRDFLLIGLEVIISKYTLNKFIL